MFTRSVRIVVSRPREEVFAYVADARNRPQWDDSVEREELTSPEPIGVAAPSATLRSMGRRLVYTWEVTEHAARADDDREHLRTLPDDATGWPSAMAARPWTSRSPAGRAGYAWPSRSSRAASRRTSTGASPG